MDWSEFGYWWWRSCIPIVVSWCELSTVWHIFQRSATWRKYPIDKSGKLIEPRKLAPSSWGYLCPAETPEGAAVGVVENLVIWHILPFQRIVHRYMSTLNVDIYSFEDIAPNQLYDGVKVFVNGTWLGIAKLNHLLSMRLKSKNISALLTSTCQLSLIRNVRRFVYVMMLVDLHVLFFKKNPNCLSCEHIKMLKTGEICWDDLLTDSRISDSVIEYIDPSEQNFGMIAMKPEKLTEKKYNNNFMFKFNIAKFIPVQSLGFWRHAFLSLNIISHQEIPINVQWVSKQWEFMLLILTSVWIKRHIFWVIQYTVCRYKNYEYDPA